MANVDYDEVASHLAPLGRMRVKSTSTCFDCMLHTVTHKTTLKLEVTTMMVCFMQKIILTIETTLLYLVKAM